MIELALFVLAHFKDESIEPLINPADRSMLFRQVGTVVLVVGTGEELLRFFEPDSALRVPPQSLTLAPIEVEPHSGSITVISFEVLRRVAGGPFKLKGYTLSMAKQVLSGRMDAVIKTIDRRWLSGPFKPCFGLSGIVSTARQSLPVKAKTAPLQLFRVLASFV